MSAKWFLIALAGILVAGAVAVVYSQYRPSQQNLLDTIDRAPSWQGKPDLVPLTDESETDQEKFTERLRAAAAAALPDATITEERLFTDNGDVWDAVRKSSDVYFRGFGYSKVTDSSTASGEQTVDYIQWRPGTGIRRAFDNRIALVLEIPTPHYEHMLVGYFVMRPNN